ncbi:MAG: PKD domain-containing protein [Thermoplasmata archaeon]|nr:MAG: PKD domain-containing protein [Thermoplasmata archaeon]
MRKTIRKILSVSLSFMMVATTLIVLFSVVVPEIVNADDPVSPLGERLFIPEDEILVLGIQEDGEHYDDVKVVEPDGLTQLFPLYNNPPEHGPWAEPPHNGRNYQRVAAGDFDYDGDAEMVICDTYTEHIQVWDPKPPDPNQRYISVWIDPSGNSLQDVDCGDFDGDHEDEIVVLGQDGNWADNIKIYEGDGTKIYPSSGWATAPHNNRNYDDVAVGDFDNDGDCEIAMLDDDEFIQIWDPYDPQGNPYGEFWYDAGGVTTYDIACGDFNGDNIDEIVVLGREDGGTRQNDIKIIAADGTRQLYPDYPFPPKYGPWDEPPHDSEDYDHVSVGDFDRDSDMELVLLEENGEDIQVWDPYDPKGTPYGEYWYDVGGDNCRDIACGDFDGDGLHLRNPAYDRKESIETTIAYVYENPQRDINDNSKVTVTFKETTEEYHTYKSFVGWGASAGIGSETLGEINLKYEREWKRSHSVQRKDSHSDDKICYTNNYDARVYSSTTFNVFTYDVYEKGTKKGEYSLLVPIETSSSVLISDENYFPSNPDHTPLDIPSYYDDSLDVPSGGTFLDSDFADVDADGDPDSQHSDEARDLSWTTGEVITDSTEVEDKIELTVEGGQGPITVSGGLSFSIGESTETKRNYEEAFDVSIEYTCVDYANEEYKAHSIIYWYTDENEDTYLVIDHSVSEMGDYYWTPQPYSTTHTDPDTWFSNNDPTFSWTTPASDYVTGYSYVLDQSPSTTPDTTAEPSGPPISYIDKADGIWYFHVRAKDDLDNWHPAGHCRIKIDTIEPIIGQVSLTPDVFSQGTSSIITAQITDTSSGISNAVAYIYEPDATTYYTSVDLSYDATLDRYKGTLRGDQTLSMEEMYVINIYAVDHASNSIEKENQACFAVVDVTTDVEAATIVNRDITPPSTEIFDFRPSPLNVDVWMEVTTSNAVEDASISVVEYPYNPEVVPPEPDADIFIEIEANQELDDEVSNVLIRVYYDEPSDPGIDETKFKLFWWNKVTSLWEEITSGVNTDDNYVWGTTTHFSLFAPFGNWRPVADAGPHQTVNKHETVYFDGSGSTDDDGYIDSYDWDFADGSPHGSGVNPTHVYTASGSYDVVLTVTDDDGSTDTDICVITVENQIPVADADGPYFGDEGNSIQLDGSDSFDPDGDPLSFYWDLDNDGDYDDSYDEKPTWTWDDEGTYTVRLKVDDGEDWDSTTSTVYVNNVAAVVDAGLDQTTYEGTTISILASFSDDGVLDTHTASINWGDGTETSGSVSESNGVGTVSGDHVYGDNGIYTVTVTVLDNDGDSGYDTLTVTVYNIAPSLESSTPKNWLARHNGEGDHRDWAEDLVTDSSGNVYVTGKSIISNYDYLTVAYDQTGNEIWAVRYSYSPSSNDMAYAIDIDESLERIYVTGWSDGDYATVAYTFSGNEVWDRRYGGTGNGNDIAKDIIIDSNGNIYVTGESYGAGTEYDYATLAYQPNGDLLWSSLPQGAAIYDGSAHSCDYAHAITCDSSGNVYVTGASFTDIWHTLDFATVSYDSQGTQRWAMRYDNGLNYDEPCDIAFDETLDRVYITGWSNSDYITIAYNSMGAQLWTATYTGLGSLDRPYALAVDDSLGNIYVTGKSYNGASWDYATVAYDSNGNELWDARYGGGCAYAIAIGLYGNVYVTGGSDEGYGNGLDYATVAYDSSGNELWVERYAGPGTDPDNVDEAYAIAVDSDGDVYVTGASFNSEAAKERDYVTIKYCQQFEGTPKTFTAKVTDPGSDDLTFRWNWGDGTSDTIHVHYNNGVGTDPSQSPWGTHPFTVTDTVDHSYGDNGIYVVTITVTDDDGGFCSDILTIIVDNVVPIVDDIEDMEAFEGTPVQFSGSFWDPGFLDTHIIEWDFGDGHTDSGTLNPEHTYADNDFYTVTLTVTDDDGGVDYVKFTVNVINIPPIPDEIESYVYIDFTLLVEGLGWDVAYMSLCENGLEIGHVAFPFYNPGDMNPENPTISNVRCDAQKIYDIEIIINPTDPPDGSVDILVKVILAYEDYSEDELEDHIFDLTNAYTWNIDISDYIVGNTVTFTATAWDPGSDDLTFEWHFGDDGHAGPTTYYNDGTFPMIATDTVTHIYNTPGIYTVTLIITDDDGGETRVIFQVHI